MIMELYFLQKGKMSRNPLHNSSYGSNMKPSGAMVVIWFFAAIPLWWTIICPLFCFYMMFTTINRIIEWNRRGY